MRSPFLGRLVIKLDEDHHHDGLRRRFADGKRQRLEDLAPKIVAAAIACAAAAVARREAEVQRKREHEEWKRNYEEQQRRARLEKKREEFLDRQLDRHQRVERLDGFLVDYRAACRGDNTRVDPGVPGLG